ncbi:MAG: hypothetical protein M3186_01330 [Actinomycetota bacterium]|nr:hypothetical protein [Actinomycetota bacterium]
MGLSLLSTLYLIGYTFEPTRLLLERYAFGLTIEAIAAIVAIMLQLATLAVYLLRRDIKAYIREFGGRAQEEIIYQDTTAVLTALWEAAEARGPGRHSLEILGHRLTAAWPLIYSKLSSRDMPRDWDITIYGLKPDPAAVGDSPLPQEWADDVRYIMRNIIQYVTDHGNDLDVRGIRITLKSYSVFPPVHGFRLDGSDIYYTYFTWSSGRDISPYWFYERIAATDSSAGGAERRLLFDVWLKEVDRKSQPLIEKNRVTGAV